jgi:hypothetical protein
MMEAIVKRATPLPSASVDATRRTRRALLLLGPVLLVAVIAAIATVSSRGDAAFVFEQQHPRIVNSQELGTLVAKAPEPTPRGPGKPATSVRCIAGSATGQRNPWRCTARYSSGQVRLYVVHVRPDGSYRGETPTGRFEVRGCCVTTPSEG